MTGPVLPPLLTGHRLDPGSDPVAAARRAAEDGAGAGTLYWTDDPARMSCALVLEPEVGRAACAGMPALAMVAFGDAAGALIPPEIAITYRWPGTLVLNGAEVGRAGLCLGQGGAVPDWLVVSLQAALRPETSGDPGFEGARTSLDEEGAAGLAPTDLLVRIARHWVSWLHRWDEAGFAPVREAWWRRRDPVRSLDRGIDGTLAALDKHGNAALADGRKLFVADMLETRAPA